MVIYSRGLSALLSLSTQFYVACNLISSTMNSIALKPPSFFPIHIPKARKTKKKEKEKGPVRLYRPILLLRPGYVIS
jgi:hypothetical protein